MGVRVPDRLGPQIRPYVICDVTQIPYMGIPPEKTLPVFFCFLVKKRRKKPLASEVLSVGRKPRKNLKFLELNLI